MMLRVAWFTLGVVSCYALLLFTLMGHACAHDRWGKDGSEPVPEWVKRACCGANDAHHLAEEQVHAMVGGYKIDGYPEIIPYNSLLPSPTGEWWAFYKVNASSNGDISYSEIYCFFGPIPGT